jgi:hypothetical protein
MNWLQLAITLFTAAKNAVHAVAQAEGKTDEQAVTDVISHLTPGKPNAPALAPTAPTK